MKNDFFDFAELASGDVRLTDFSDADRAPLRAIADRINRAAYGGKALGFMPFAMFDQNPADPDYDAKLDAMIGKKMAAFARRIRENPRRIWYFAVRDGGDLAGYAAVDAANENDPVFGDIGYFIDPLFAGRGIATAACRLVLDQWFRHYDKMEAAAHPDNIFSKKMLVRLGGEFIRHAELERNGIMVPRDIFRITKERYVESAC